MGIENLHGKSERGEDVKLLLGAFRMPNSFALSEKQFENARLLGSLERYEIIPVVQNPNPFSPVEEQEQYEQWVSTHLEEFDIYDEAFDQRTKALRYLYLGKLIGSTLAPKGEPYTSEETDFQLQLLQMSSRSSTTQYYFERWLEERGLLSVFEKEGVLQHIIQDDEEQLRQSLDMRSKQLGYLYIGYQLGRHIDERMFVGC